MNAETTEQESTLHKLKFLADASHVMQAEIARTDISLNEVMLWKQGTVVILDKIVGVRISEITHPDEKPKLGWK